MDRKFFPHSMRRSQVIWFTVLTACLVMGSGCVSRRMMVYSDPPGALVLLEGKEVGYTPVAVDFLYYGTRELTLIKDGFETKKVLQKVSPPWYQWPVIEFFADNLMLSTVTDRQAFNYSLEPRRIGSNEDLLNRAENLRTEAQISPD